MSEDADVDRLTRAEIEAAHDALCAAVALNLDMSKHWCEQKWKQAHMLRDLALQSLSQEAVRDEALDEAANELERAFAEADTLNLLHGAARVRALKREPNAAAQAGQDASTAPSHEGHAAGPAPAAPDVASMVKDYPNLYMMLHGAVSGHYTEWPLMRKELTALLARLGQGWVPQGIPIGQCCCRAHHPNYGRCLQCPIHGTATARSLR